MGERGGGKGEGENRERRTVTDSLACHILR